MLTRDEINTTISEWMKEFIAFCDISDIKLKQFILARSVEISLIHKDRHYFLFEYNVKDDQIIILDSMLVNAYGSIHENKALKLFLVYTAHKILEKIND